MDAWLAKYADHKKKAAQRGIAFDLTYEEWREIWGEHIAKRGRNADQLGMLRNRDEGAYAVGNVRLGTPKENAQERAVVARVKSAQMWRAKTQDYLPDPSARDSWLNRHRAFDEYVEEEEFL